MNQEEKLLSWISRLQIIADEMEIERQEVNAEHVDFIVSDLKADCSELQHEGIITFYENKFNFKRS